MTSLASQSFAASTQPVEAVSVAQAVPALGARAATPAMNDNAIAWKPSLLVQRRRRLTRRAGRH